MESLNHSIHAYHELLARGDLQKAYRGLINCMMALRNHIAKTHPDWKVAGSIYPGQMDYTFFSLSPDWLRRKDLKVLVLLDHGPMRLEAWLSGVNRLAQRKYHDFFKEKGAGQYRLIAQGPGVDAVLQHNLVETPDFEDQEGLNRVVEEGVRVFLGEVGRMLGQWAD